MFRETPKLWTSALTIVSLATVEDAFQLALFPALKQRSGLELKAMPAKRKSRKASNEAV